MSTPPEFLALREKEVLNHWTSGSASEQFGAGVASAASTEGLHALRAAYPETWHRLVYTWTPEIRSDRRVKLGELLASRFCHRAMPRHADDYERVCRYRRAARRLVERFGRRGLAWFTDERLEEYREELVSGGCSASTASRTVSYLRVVLREWCRWQRARPKVQAKPSGPRRRVGARAARRFAAPLAIARLLPALSAEQRAMVALAAAGLLQSEFLALRVEDVWHEHQAVAVRTGGIRGRPGVACDRIEYLPSWAWDLFATSLESMGRRRGLLFPPRGGGEKPRASAARGLRRVCDRVMGRGNGVTFVQIRDLGREVVRRAGAPRAAVRQTWTRQDFGRRGPPWLPEAKQLMASWTELCVPPVGLASSGRVPRRAPAACSAMESELSAAAGKTSMVVLPASCRPMAASPSHAEVQPDSSSPTPEVAYSAEMARNPEEPRTVRNATSVVTEEASWGPRRSRSTSSRSSGPRLDRRPARRGARPNEAVLVSDQPSPELAAADIERIVAKLAEQLDRRRPGPAGEKRTPELSVPRLRRELAVAMQRRSSERIEDFLAGAAVGAGGAWAASNPQAVRAAIGKLGLEGGPGVVEAELVPDSSVDSGPVDVAPVYFYPLAEGWGG